MQISDKKERTLTFGKYKGQEIKYIILTDIGISCGALKISGGLNLLMKNKLYMMQ